MRNYLRRYVYVRKCTDSDWCPAGEGNATHPQVYLTFGDPVGPWGNTPAPANAPRTCWSKVLKDACEWMPESGYDASHERDAMDRLAYKAYTSSGKIYNGGAGATHYVEFSGKRRFNLWTLMGPTTDADCQDMSLWWEMLCHSAGTNAYARRIDGSFATKSILPVGLSTWATTTWNFHHIGWDNNVFDPCIEVKESDPRVPQDEGINSPYKTDLYNSGTWNPYSGFAIGDTDPYYSETSEVN
jgi:hypothetical protein